MQRINIYDIYADVCLPKHVHNQVSQFALQLDQHPANSTVPIARPGELDQPLIEIPHHES